MGSLCTGEELRLTTQLIGNCEMDTATPLVHPQDDHLAAQIQCNMSEPMCARVLTNTPRASGWVQCFQTNLQSSTRTPLG